MKVRHDGSKGAVHAPALAVCGLVTLLLLAACGAKDSAPAEAKPIVRGSTIEFPAGSGAVARLKVGRVEEPVARDITLTGRLVWDEERTVCAFPPFSGRVTRIRAQVGERVAAGAPLAEIASADFGQARADLRKAQADLALASRSAERARELNAHGVASAKDLQQAEADHARARAESERAQARLRDYGQSEESGTFVLKSPVAGTVVERNLNPGQEVRSDQSGPPLFVISDPTHLWISLDANEPDAARLRPGMALALFTAQSPQDSYAGTLKQVSEFVDPVARTVKLRGDVPNPQRLLRAETFVNARVNLPKGTNPTVNAKAVYLWGNRRYVFVKRGEATFVRSAVEVGPEIEGRVPVISGLEVGDTVVVAGNLFLQQILASVPPETTTAAQQ